MAISPVDFHFRFLDWFSKTYPELHESYSGKIVLHINEPVITIRSAGIDEPIIKELQKIVEEFNQQLQP